MSVPTAGPGPYGQPSPVPPHVPAPAARSRGFLIVAAVVLGLAVVFSAAFLVGRLTASPAAASSTTSPASSARSSAGPSSGTPRRVGFTLTGSTLSGPGYTATIPSGWTLGADNGVSTNDGVIENGTDNSLAYFASDPNPAATRCHNAIESYRTKLGGTVVDLPGVRWAGGSAVVKELETAYSTGQAIGIDLYCVDRPNGTSAAILSIAAPLHQPTNKAAAEALLASWTWT